MKRNALLLTVFLLFVGCVVQNEQEIVETNAADAIETIAAAQTIRLEDALAEMYSLMDNIGPGTRSSISIKSVDIIGGQTLGYLTRSTESIMDSLLYLVNFDGGGFSVLAADARLESVLALSLQGGLSLEDFTGGDTAAPYSLSDLWVEEDGDYLLGDVGGGEFIADMIISYATNAIFDPNPPTDIDDGNGGGTTDPENPGNPGNPGSYSYYFTDWQVDEANTNRRILNNNIRWRQGSPFDEYCPPIGEEKAPAGCTAIAVMQIIAHHQSPSAEEFGQESYSTSYGNVSPLVDLTLSWPALTDSTVAKFNTSLRHTAGWIARWIGHKCKMRYNYLGSEGSFATPKSAADFLKELDYDAVRYLGYKEEKLRESIMEGNPGIVGGISNEKEETRSSDKSKGGHAWVADGWMTRYANLIRRYSDGTETIAGKKTQTLVHCNWGWGGLLDGYYYSGMFKLISGPAIIGEGDYTGDGTRIDNYDFLMRTVIIKCEENCQ